MPARKRSPEKYIPVQEIKPEFDYSRFAEFAVTTSEMGALRAILRPSAIFQRSFQSSGTESIQELEKFRQWRFKIPYVIRGARVATSLAITDTHPEIRLLLLSTITGRSRNGIEYIAYGVPDADSFFYDEAKSKLRIKPDGQFYEADLERLLKELKRGSFVACVIKEPVFTESFQEGQYIVKMDQKLLPGNTVIEKEKRYVFHVLDKDSGDKLTPKRQLLFALPTLGIYPITEVKITKKEQILTLSNDSPKSDNSPLPTLVIANIPDSWLIQNSELMDIYFLNTFGYAVMQGIEKAIANSLKTLPEITSAQQELLTPFTDTVLQGLNTRRNQENESEQLSLSLPFKEIAKIINRKKLFNKRKQAVKLVDSNVFRMDQIFIKDLPKILRGEISTYEIFTMNLQTEQSAMDYLQGIAIFMLDFLEAKVKNREYDEEYKLLATNLMFRMVEDIMFEMREENSLEGMLFFLHFIGEEQNKRYLSDDKQDKNSYLEVRNLINDKAAEYVKLYKTINKKNAQQIEFVRLFKPHAKDTFADRAITKKENLPRQFVSIFAFSSDGMIITTERGGITTDFSGRRDNLMAGHYQENKTLQENMLNELQEEENLTLEQLKGKIYQFQIPFTDPTGQKHMTSVYLVKSALTATEIKALAVPNPAEISNVQAISPATLRQDLKHSLGCYIDKTPDAKGIFTPQALSVAANLLYVLAQKEFQNDIPLFYYYPESKFKPPEQLWIDFTDVSTLHIANEWMQKIEYYLQQKILHELEKGRPNFDLPHTRAVVTKLHEILQYNPDLKIDTIVLEIAAYAHDWGYANLYQLGGLANFESVMRAKEEHMEIGAQNLEILLQSSVFSELTNEQKQRAIHLVKIHDRLSELHAIDELILMEADTLGALDTKPTFDEASNQRYLEKDIIPRSKLFITEHGKKELERLINKRKRYYEDLKSQS